MPKAVVTYHCRTHHCTHLLFSLRYAYTALQRAVEMLLSRVKWQTVLVYG